MCLLYHFRPMRLICIPSGEPPPSSRMHNESYKLYQKPIASSINFFARYTVSRGDNARYLPCFYPVPVYFTLILTLYFAGLEPFPFSP